MALLIEKPIEILGGVSVNQIYTRFEVNLEFNGKTVRTNALNFTSESAYKENVGDNAIYVAGIPGHMVFNYDASVDGSDVLLFVHEKYKEYLSTDVYEDVPVEDPSTGDYQYDPSTGEMITESVLTRPKFADASQISFVNI